MLEPPLLFASIYLPCIHLFLPLVTLSLCVRIQTRTPTWKGRRGMGHVRVRIGVVSL